MSNGLKPSPKWWIVLLGLLAAFFVTSFATGTVVKFNETRSASRIAASVSPNIQAALDGDKVVLAYKGGDQFIYYEVGSGAIISTREPRTHLTAFGTGSFSFAAPGAVVVSLMGSGVVGVSAADIVKQSGQVSDWAADPRGAVRSLRGRGSTVLIGLAGVVSGYFVGEAFGARLGELAPPRSTYIDEMLRKRETWGKIAEIAHATLSLQIRERRERLADEVVRREGSADLSLRTALIECRLTEHPNPLLSGRPSALLCPDLRSSGRADEESFRALLVAVSLESTLRDEMVKKVARERG